MPWVVFGDFNETIHSDEKLGGVDRDARQMEAFRECLSRCELIDLGFIGQKFTWCNGRFGEQRTLLRLDQMVANEGWTESFFEARVLNSSIPISNHCLMILNLSNRPHRKPGKRRFLFEAMWTRDKRCREVVELAWNPLGGDPSSPIMDRVKRCQVQLQRWIWKEFGNISYLLKQKKDRLQQLESLNSLHEKCRGDTETKKGNK